MEIPAINLKAILVVHWLLTIWGCLIPWLPSSYMWGNLSVLAVGVWAVAQRDSVDAVFMFLIGLLLTIVLDIIHFAIFYSSGSGDLFHFSSGMAIFSLIIKPFSCFFIYQMYRERGGEYNINFGFPTVTQNRDTYQPIDQQGQSDNMARPYIQGEDQKPGVRAY